MSDSQTSAEPTMAQSSDSRQKEERLKKEARKL